MVNTNWGLAIFLAHCEATSDEPPSVLHLDRHICKINLVVDEGSWCIHFTLSIRSAKLLIKA
jgi:hypothetical protein